MTEVWILAVGAGLLLSFLGGNWWAGRKDRWGESPGHLEEAVQHAGLLNSNFSHSLEMVQNLESLLLRAEEAEQNLRRLLMQAEVGRADQYSTAALLISEGKEVEQVARTLKLPHAQVRLIQELRQVMEKKRQASLGGRQGKESRSKERARKENGADPREKIAEGYAERHAERHARGYAGGQNGAVGLGSGWQGAVGGK